MLFLNVLYLQRLFLILRNKHIINSKIERIYIGKYNINVLKSYVYKSLIDRVNMHYVHFNVDHQLK